MTSGTAESPVSGATLIRSVLGELSLDTFRRDYFGRRFVAMPGDDTRYSSLFSWDALSHLLESRQFTPDTLRLKKAGLDVPTSDYLTDLGSKRGSVAFRVRGDRIAAELQDGATVVINQLDQIWPPVRDLAVALEGALQACVNINMYAGISDKHAFSTHYDMHDVFALQVHGQKHWKVFQRRSRLPYDDDRFEAREAGAVGAPIWDEVITQGEALYLPRGYWHFAEPTGVPTIHLAVGIVEPTGRDLLRWATRLASERDVLRSTCPRLGTTEERRLWLEEIKAALLEHLLDETCLSAFESAFLVEETRVPRASVSLNRLVAGARIAGGTIRAASPHALIPHDVSGSPNSVQIYIDGREGPKFRRVLAPLLADMAASLPVSLSDMRARHLDAIGDQVFDALIGALLAEGVITLS